jgi:hypothetical protein
MERSFVMEALPARFVREADGRLPLSVSLSLHLRRVVPFVSVTGSRLAGVSSHIVSV